MSSMGTDEDAVRSDADSAAMTRGNGDSPPLADIEVLATEAAFATDGPDGDEVPGPEAPEVAAAEVAVQSSEPANGTGSQEPSAPDEPVAELDEDLDLPAAPAAMSQMVFVNVVLLLPATHPVVVLQEADAPFRELRIPVGGAEGIAISYAARGLATPRPLTHELFTRVLEEFGMTLDVVRITEVRGTAFTAEMVISGRLGTRLIDCRPSDAIALALRHRLPVPIMVDPTVLEVAGTDPMGAN